MPLNGLVSFLRVKSTQKQKAIKGVNALKRASIISTPTYLKRPVYGGSEGVNSPRFLKIFQKCTFLPNFWFFQNFLQHNTV